MQEKSVTTNQILLECLSCGEKCHCAKGDEPKGSGTYLECPKCGSSYLQEAGSPTLPFDIHVGNTTFRAGVKTEIVKAAIDRAAKRAS